MNKLTGKYIKCNLCGSSNSKELYVIEKEGKFRIVKCRKCGLVYQNPRPSKSEIHNMYNEDYFKGKGFDKSIDYYSGLKKKDAWNIVNRNRILNIEKYTKKGRILDIGCGLGDFLDVARLEGWKSYGVEVSKFSANFAKKRFKVNVFNGTLKKARFKTGFFNAITMIEVIEHLEDPLSELKECNRIMEKGGIIVIQTGNIDGLYAKISGSGWFYFLLGHLNYFSKKTIRKALEISKFKVLKIYNGDEISILAHSRCFWYYLNKNPYNFLKYCKFLTILIARKLGLGGMTVYAKKK